MYVKPFGYVSASTVEQATEVLRHYGPDSKVLAGGQSLVPMLNLGLVQVGVLVDVTRIPGLGDIVAENGRLRIGALARYRSLEHSAEVAGAHPLIVAAVQHIGSPRIRNCGTVGGSLAHNDPVAELPAVMSVLEAEYELTNGRRVRTVTASTFPVTYYTTQLEPDELLATISVPLLTAGWGWGFKELSRRAGDFAVVAAAAVARCRGGRIEDVRLALSGVGETVRRCRVFETAARGIALEELDSVGVTITEEVFPLDDPATGTEYRGRLARVLGLRAVRDACMRSEGELE